MDEILQKLLQSELLSEETKAEISEQWTSSVEAYKTQIREEAANEVRLQLSEQWIAEREELITKVDTLVAETLTKEITELKGDIERFRDLEAEYAGKLVEEKQNMAEEVASELDELVDKIDAFFEMRLSAEMEELREDLEIVKQNEFGRRMFEAFATEYAKNYVDEDAVQSQLTIAEQKLQDAERALSESEEQVAKMLREQKMEQILTPLTGKKREQMAMVLKNVETGRLEESYKYFVGRILKEDAEPTKQALNEDKSEVKNTVITGSSADNGEKEQKAGQVNESLAHLRRLAGIK